MKIYCSWWQRATLFLSKLRRRKQSILKITISFRDHFDTAIGLRVLEVAFQDFQIWIFSGGACPQTPLQARTFGARKYFLYHYKLSRLLLVPKLVTLPCVSSENLHSVCIAYHSNIKIFGPGYWGTPPPSRKILTLVNSNRPTSRLPAATPCWSL